MAFKKYTQGKVDYIVQYLECRCSSDEHQIMIKYFLDKDDDFLSLSIHLVSERNIFKRIVTAFKYIFGYKSKHSDFEEFIFKREDIFELMRVLEDYQKIKVTKVLN